MEYENYREYRQAFTLTEEAFLRQRRELGEGAPLLSVLIGGVHNRAWSGLKDALEGQSCQRFEVLTDRATGLPKERVLAGTSLRERGRHARGLGLAWLPAGAVPRREWAYHLVRGLIGGGDIVYTDEEIIDIEAIDIDGAVRPDFKPGYGAWSMLGRNILGRSVAVRRQVYDACGGYGDASPEGWYDFMLRGTEAAGRIAHIPLVLLRVGKLPPPVATWPVERALCRRGIGGTVGQGEAQRVFLPRLFIKGEPLITLLVRGSGALEPLKNLLEWVERRSVYGRYEWVISLPTEVGEEAEKYLQALEKQGAARVYQEAGSPATCLNRCANRAQGEYLLFMEEGCLPLTANFMGRLLEWASLPRVGVVGGRQCPGRGWTLLPGQMPGLPPVLLAQGEGWEWTEAPRNVSCVPLGGAMVQRERFWRAGGLEEAIGHGYMETLSLKLGRMGYPAVYCPEANFAVPVPENRSTMDARCREVFQTLLYHGDPLFNPNLSCKESRLHLNLPPLPPGEQRR